MAIDGLRVTGQPGLWSVVDKYGKSLRVFPARERADSFVDSQLNEEKKDEPTANPYAKPVIPFPNYGKATPPPSPIQTQTFPKFTVPDKPAPIKFNVPEFDPNKPIEYGRPVFGALSSVGRSALDAKIAANATEENPAVRQYLNSGSMQDFSNYISNASVQATQFGKSVYELEYGGKLTKATSEFAFLSDLSLTEFRGEIEGAKLEYDRSVGAQESALNRAFVASQQNNELAYRKAVVEFEAAERRAEIAVEQAHEMALAGINNDSKMALERLRGRTSFGESFQTAVEVAGDAKDAVDGIQSVIDFFKT